jgi:hypothetical protein
LYRYTRNQEGVLLISMRSKKSREDIIFDTDGAVMRPGGPMVVLWELPERIYFDAQNEDLRVGLVRYGSLSNSPCVVAKQLGKLSNSTVRTKDMFGNNIVKGKLQFHAPKAAGTFLYRMFDQSSKDRALITLGTSPSFSVVLQDIDVTSNLKFCWEAFRDGNNMRGITQLQSTISGMTNSGKPMQGDHPQQLLQKCVRHTIELIQQGIGLLDASKGRSRAPSLAEPRGPASSSTNNSSNHSSNGNGNGIGGGAGSGDPHSGSNHNAVGAGGGGGADLPSKNDDHEFWSAVRAAGKMHVEAYETLLALQTNRIAWSLLSDELRQVVSTSEGLFCPLLQRYFGSKQSVEEGRSRYLGFLPAPDDAASASTSNTTSTRPDRASLSAIDKSISELLPSLMPGGDFEAKREAIRASVQAALQASGVVPTDTEVALYGSSRNNFGREDADVDMCLMLPVGHDVPSDERPAAIERLGEALVKAGMSEVKTRATARIPIVHFIDPTTGQRYRTCIRCKVFKNMMGRLL